MTALWLVRSWDRIGLQRGEGGAFDGEAGWLGLLSTPLANLGVRRQALVKERKRKV
jgi:hypothetical protein